MDNTTAVIVSRVSTASRRATEIAAYNDPMRYLGVDPGGRRVGLAVGDDLTGVVTPLAVIDCRGTAAAAEAVRSAARTHDATCVVVGLPTAADGTPTAACRRSELLATELRQIGYDVVLQPEFLSTDEARRRARELGLPADQPVDHLAAQVLLEEYLADRPRATS
jgi:putative Holliday junction resolvase